MHFTLHLMIHLTMQSRGAPECTFNGRSKNALSDLDGACEVALNSAFEVALEQRLWLLFLMQLLTHICVQNGSSTGGPDATLKGALVGRLNVGFEWVPQCSL